MKAERSFFRFGDFVILALLALLCVGLFLAPLLTKEGTALTAEVIVGGETVETLALSSLSGDVTRRVSGCEIVFSRKGVRVASADCPDKLCVKTGEIRHPGESIACVPNRVVVVLRDSGSKDRYDGVAY